MNIADILLIGMLALIVPMALKPCLWNIVPHKWRSRGKVDICTRCKLMKQKVEK